MNTGNGPGAGLALALDAGVHRTAGWLFAAAHGIEWAGGDGTLGVELGHARDGGSAEGTGESDCEDGGRIGEAISAG